MLTADLQVWGGSALMLSRGMANESETTSAIRKAYSRKKTLCVLMCGRDASGAIYALINRFLFCKVRILSLQGSLIQGGLLALWS